VELLDRGAVIEYIGVRVPLVVIRILGVSDRLNRPVIVTRPIEPDVVGELVEVRERTL
jgi:hypothetical protein